MYKLYSLYCYYISIRNEYPRKKKYPRNQARSLYNDNLRQLTTLQQSLFIKTLLNLMFKSDVGTWLTQTRPDQTRPDQTRPD